jgi:hypothetical protein
MLPHKHSVRPVSSAVTVYPAAAPLQSGQIKPPAEAEIYLGPFGNRRDVRMDLFAADQVVCRVGPPPGAKDSQC